MGAHDREDKTEAQLKGFAAHILKEVIQADMSMHDAQLDAWAHFIRHKPEGAYINENIMEGMPQANYLFLNEVNLSFHVKPVANDSVWRRVKHAYRILFGRSGASLYRPVFCDLCGHDDPAAMPVQVKVIRTSDGAVKASYGPVDDSTMELWETSKTIHA